MEENKKKKILYTSLIVIVMLLIVSGVTYAWFSTKSEIEEQITTAKTELIVSVDEDDTHITNIKPTKWNEDIDLNKENSDIIKIPITVTNNSDISLTYTLTLNSTDLSLNEDNTLVGGFLEDIQYRLYNSDSTEELAIGDLINPEYLRAIIRNKKIENNSSDYYILYLYIDDTGELQNKLQGLDFNVQINGDSSTEEPKKEKTLSQIIKDNEVPIENDPDFSATSVDRGLFKMNTKKGNIYYYKGSTENSKIRTIYTMNNYVEFGTYKKDSSDISNDNPILWRIMRINEDNSITLIMEHNIGDEETQQYVWNSTNRADYVNLDNTDSEIKQTIDNWYNEIFDGTEEDKLVKKTEFCNDRSNSYLAVRFSTGRLTLECAREEDKIEAKAGLITADEMVMSGAGVDNTSTSYMFNGSGFWTMSPYNLSQVYGTVDYTLHFIREIPTNNSLSARPVITLIPNVTFTSNPDSTDEVGTINNPYKIIVE